MRGKYKLHEDFFYLRFSHSTCSHRQKGEIVLAILSLWGYSQKLCVGQCVGCSWSKISEGAMLPRVWPQLSELGQISKGATLQEARLCRCGFRWVTDWPCLASSLGPSQDAPQSSCVALGLRYQHAAGMVETRSVRMHRVLWCSGHRLPVSFFLFCILSGFPHSQVFGGRDFDLWHCLT